MSFFDPYNKKPGAYFTEQKSDKQVLAGIPRSVLGVMGVAKWGPFEATLSYSMAELLQKYGSNISYQYQTMRQLNKAFLNYGNSVGNMTVAFARIAHYTDPTDPATLTALKAGGFLYDANATPASIGAAVAADGNTGDDVAASGGTYTGTINGTYKATVTTGAATYAASVVSLYFSPDGTNWTLLKTYTPISGDAQTIEKGVTITLTDAATPTGLVKGDEWTIPVVAEGMAEGDKRIEITAKYHGTLGNDIVVKTLAPSNGVAGDFNLEILVGGISKRLYTNLSPDLESANYFASIINADSIWITVTDIANIQDVGLAQTITLTGGDDGITGLVDADYIGDPDAKTGAYQFSVYKYPLTICCFDADVKSSPDTLYRAIYNWINTKAMRNFQITCIPKAITVRDDIVDYLKTTLQFDTKRGAIYYGWGIDEDDGEIIPLTGAIAGIYCTVADTIGVWENPAGSDFPLKGFSGLHFALSDTAHGVCNENRINVCTIEQGRGIVIDGSRTLAFTENANYFWIGQTRNTYDLEARIDVNTNVKHKLSKNSLYNKLYTIAYGILNARDKEGGLDNEAGTPFGVICDASIQTDEYKNKGVTLIKWGIRNWKTSEFQWFELTPFTDGSSL